MTDRETLFAYRFNQAEETLTMPTKCWRPALRSCPPEVYRHPLRADSY